MARSVGAWGTVILGACVLIPMVPNWPYAEQPAAVPSFFTTADADAVPPGSLAITYPYPLTATAWAMLWQADTDMRFRMLGGYAIGPGANGAGTFFPDTNDMEYCLLGIYTTGSVPADICTPSVVRMTLKKLGVTSVIDGMNQQHATVALGVFRSALGRPRQVGGVWLWRCQAGAHGGACRWT